MAGNPNLIGGGRLTRAETSGDKRRFEGKKLDMGALLLRLWRYIGRNKILVILAVVLWVLTNKVKKVKNLHPIVFILGSAVVGILFSM